MLEKRCNGDTVKGGMGETVLSPRLPFPLSLILLVLSH